MTVGPDLWRTINRRCHYGDERSSLPGPPHFSRTQSNDGSEEPIFIEDVLADTGSSPLTDSLFDADPSELGLEQEIGRRNSVEARRAFQEEGTEALAWYAPIHFFADRVWGVWINEPLAYGWCYSAFEDLKLADEGWDALRDDLFRCLIRHEYFHAAVELFALVLEDMAAAKTGGPLREAPLDEEITSALAGHRCEYGAYFHKTYQTALSEGTCQEEGIAVALQLDGPFTTRGLRDWLIDQLCSAPASYQLWPDFEEAEDRFIGIRALTGSILVRAIPLPYRIVLGLDDEGWPPVLWFPDLFPGSLDRFAAGRDGLRSGIPIHRHGTAGLRSRRFMPFQLDTLPRKPFLKFLKQRGYAEVPESYSKHPKIVMGGKSIPCKFGDTVPHYVVRQVAEVLGKDARSLLREFKAG